MQLDTGTTSEATVKLNDFSRSWADVGADAEAAFSAVGSSGWYVLGRQVESFEASLAKYARTDHSVGCASGLDAIEIALRALNLGDGEPVLTTPLSAFATTLAILRAGGRPVFVDVDEDGLLDLDLAEQLFTAVPSLKAMVPVHLYGRSLDLERLADLKQRFGLRIVEDMAQALGATSNGRAVGSVGQLSATSFYPTKNLGCFGDGGAVLTSEQGLADRCRSLRDYGQSAKYVHAELGLNSRLDEVQAALMSQAMLPRLDGWTARRREIAARYGAEIDHAKVSLPTASQESVWHLFVVRCDSRQGLQAHLKSCGVESAVHYPILIPDQPCMALSETFAELPTARRLAETVLSLPIHPYLSDGEVDRVVTAVNSWQG